MFGPDAKDAQIAALTNELNDRADNWADLQQNLALANERIAKMVVIRDPAQIGVLALGSAKEIEDLFVRSWESVAERRNALALLVRHAIENALLGDKASNI